MQPTHDNGDSLETLMEEFIARCRGGETPSVEDYAARHPDLAEEIRDLFPTILTVENVKHASAATSDTLDARWEPPLGRLGDFRIIREIGRGGMGIVYEAEQESLGRRVAIKVLPRQHIGDSKRRERFDRESRTAAKLHHTNIVPIFGVGEQDGYRYFVMQYIRGAGLDVVFRTLADVAEGLSPPSMLPSSALTGTGALVRAARELLDYRRGSGSTSDVSTLTGSVRTGSTGDRRDTSSPAETPRGLKPAAHPDYPRQSKPASLSDHPGGSNPAAFSSSESAAPGVLNARYWRDLAVLMAQAADALAYAHSQDVLHRDVKPSNLLLDGDGTLWVADFGLAKAIDHEAITQVGDVVGTLRYMAPEQFKGRMEVRSDVYSLGVTLYELATLRPAFTESKASSVIHAIMEKPLTPPRQVCPSMPRDLETIVLKATAREPAHRYASAADLRDDLRRYAEDRPIYARRVSPAERLRRWAWRNPALATVTGLSFALLAAVAAVSSAAYVNVHSANSRTKSALLGEQQQRQRAEGTADLAVKALDTIFNEFAPESVLSSSEFSVDGSEDYTVSVSVPVPVVLSRETATFLEHMLDFYRKLGQQEGGSVALQMKVAAAQRRVGEIHERLGRNDEAKAAYSEAIRHYEALQPGAGETAALQTALARAHNLLAGVFLAEHNPDAADSHLQESRSLLRPLVERGGAAAEPQFELARALYLSAKPDIFGGMKPGPGPGGPGRGPGPGGRRERFRGGEGEPGRRGPRPDEGPEGRGQQPGTPPAPWGDFRERFERWMKERQGYLEEAEQILTRLNEQSPRVAAYRHLLARCLRELQGLPASSRDDGPRREKLDRAIKLLEALAAETSEPQYRFDLADTYAAHALRDESPEAKQRMVKAMSIMEKLTSEQPNVPSYRLALARMHGHMAWVYWRSSQPEEALETLRRSVALNEQVMERFPDNPEYVLAAVPSQALLAEALRGRGDTREACEVLERARDRLEQLPQGGNTDLWRRGGLSSIYRLLASLYDDLGETQLEQQARSKAEELRPPWPGRGRGRRD